MGVISEKSILTGLFGGVSVSKKTGQQTLNVLSPGPKIHKVRTVESIALPSGGIPFGLPIDCSLNMAEQKFSDFNGSFTDAQSIQIKPTAKAA